MYIKALLIEWLHPPKELCTCFESACAYYWKTLQPLLGTGKYQDNTRACASLLSLSPLLVVAGDVRSFFTELGHCQRSSSGLGALGRVFRLRYLLFHHSEVFLDSLVIYNLLLSDMTPVFKCLFDGSQSSKQVLLFFWKISGVQLFGSVIFWQ